MTYSSSYHISGVTYHSQCRGITDDLVAEQRTIIQFFLELEASITDIKENKQKVYEFAAHGKSCIRLMVASIF